MSLEVTQLKSTQKGENLADIINRNMFCNSLGKHPWVLTVHLEFEMGGRLHMIFQQQVLVSTHFWIIN